MIIAIPFIISHIVCSVCVYVVYVYVCCIYFGFFKKSIQKLWCGLDVGHLPDLYCILVWNLEYCIFGIVVGTTDYDRRHLIRVLKTYTDIQQHVTYNHNLINFSGKWICLINFFS